MGGIPGCVSPDPEITTFMVNKQTDYVFLACDGVFDVLSNNDVNQIIWETIHNYKDTCVRKGVQITAKQKEDCLQECVNNVLKMAMIEKSEDNVTLVIVVINDLFG